MLEALANRCRGARRSGSLQRPPPFRHGSATLASDPSLRLSHADSATLDMIASGCGQHGKRWCAMDWETLSRKERDAAYNNTEAVADSGALSEARIAASAAIRAAHPGALDLAYGPRERNRWD